MTVLCDAAVSKCGFFCFWSRTIYFLITTKYVFIFKTVKSYSRLIIGRVIVFTCLALLHLAVFACTTCFDIKKCTFSQIMPFYCIFKIQSDYFLKITNGLVFVIVMRCVFVPWNHISDFVYTNIRV